MPRHITITCHRCTHIAPVHQFPGGRDNRDRIRSCPNCNCIVQRNGTLVNNAIAGYRRFQIADPTPIKPAAPAAVKTTINIVGYIDARTADVTVHIQDDELADKFKAPLETLFNNPITFDGGDTCPT